MDPAAIAIVQRVAMEEGGLYIGADKADFLIARLSSEVDRLGLADFGAYARHLDHCQKAGERRRFIEALTTHTTSFFRERVQYDWLESTAIPALARRAGKRPTIAIWSAACSSGQELYSSVMATLVTLEAQGIAGIGVTGVGTDLSARILRRAETAVYTAEEIESLPMAFRQKYLLSARAGPKRYRIAPSVRALTHWTQANLTSMADLDGVRADIAFLRNVLIYFDPPTRHRALRNVISRINPGGYLLTGHSETIRGEDYGLKPVRPSVYHKEH